jgi:hypothetical protein
MPLHALTGPEGSSRLRIPDFKTIGTWRWQGCQSYAPAAFIPRALVRPEGLSMKKSSDTIGNRTRDLPVCTPRCRQVSWGNFGIFWVNCTVPCMKDDWKGQIWSLRYCLSNLRSSPRFPWGMTSHSKIAQFNWECIGRFTLTILSPTYKMFIIKCNFIQWTRHYYLINP